MLHRKQFNNKRTFSNSSTWASVRGAFNILFSLLNACASVRGSTVFLLFSILLLFFCVIFLYIFMTLYGLFYDQFTITTGTPIMQLLPGFFFAMHDRDSAKQSSPGPRLSQIYVPYFLDHFAPLKRSCPQIVHAAIPLLT